MGRVAKVLGTVAAGAVVITLGGLSQLRSPDPSPLTPSAGSLGAECGVDRWGVKTGTDPNAGQVVTAPLDVTITSLAVAQAPHNPPDRRSAPQEYQVYRIAATVTAYKTEADSDVHLALSDGSGHTMIAEIPDAGCVDPSSPFAAAIALARAQWDARFSESGSYRTVTVPVVLTGIGFFDRLHGQRGVAPNGIELHPVLSVSFS